MFYAAMSIAVWIEGAGKLFTAARWNHFLSLSPNSL